ncbi:ATP-binding protein [Streptomyces sp. NPDC008141]|uniref:ATP-binding protein n=1 Tax=Streptomyces sp. NPDC008141 TaxID=3364815 RepID=UPI0036E8B872
MLGIIPEESTSFVGRNWELFRLDRALARDRLVTLVGTGGVGKSRLALRAAREAQALFPDGVAWADLSPLHGDRLLLSTVSDACDLADHTPRMPVDALCEWLAGKRLLLVLDSCEHLVDACRELVADLLTAVADLTVLVTSREPLGMEGERLIEVEPLPPGGPDALDLFTQRVAAASSAAQSPETETETGTETGTGTGTDAGATTGTEAGARSADAQRAAAAIQICRRLEGIPLALELAAAQAGRTTVEEIAERLGSRFDVLATAGPGVRPQRHRTMRTAIGWSHELCAPLERLLWARLTVFRGDFDLESARAVCSGGPLGADAVDALLGRLVAVSVVTVVAGGDGIRYRMLDTIREYGHLWLRALHEEAALAERHADHFLRFAQDADAGWLSADQTRWYRRIAEADTDLCTALDHLLATSPERALRLVGLVGFFWSCCGHLHEARGYLEQALAAHPSDGADRTRALWALGITLTLQGEYEDAQRVGEQCTRAAWREGDTDELLAATYLTGLIALLTGRPVAAHLVTEHGLGAAPGEPFDSAARLRCHLVQVFALTGLGKLHEARERALWLRAGCVERGEFWSRAYLDYQLALIDLFSGNPLDAAAHARSMLESKRGLGDSFGIALGLDVLAAAIAAAGDGELAGLVYGTGQSFWHTVGHPQRGTPDLRAVREECERTARAKAGDEAYESAYQWGLTADPAVALSAALGARCGSTRGGLGT